MCFKNDCCQFVWDSGNQFCGSFTSGQTRWELQDKLVKKWVREHFYKWANWIGFAGTELHTALFSPLSLKAKFTNHNIHIRLNKKGICTKRASQPFSVNCPSKTLRWIFTMFADFKRQNSSQEKTEMDCKNVAHHFLFGMWDIVCVINVGSFGKN